MMLLSRKSVKEKSLTNAFTLVELLAVIIILAIIALIAVPIILDVVDDAKISAGKSEAQMILGGINNYCAIENVKYQMDNNFVRLCTTSLDENKVKEMVNLGSATIESIKYNGSKLTELVIESNNHKFTLCVSGQFVMDDEECSRFPASLISLLLEQYTEDNTTGLVKDSLNENLYYYTGTNEEVSNNFLWYGGHQWRVLEFDTEENTLTLITQQPLTAIESASVAWTTEETYNNSHINNWLNEYFWNSLDSSIQSNILDNTFNIGIYSDVDEITTVKKVGLLDEEQYERAGGTDSFLDIKDCWWPSNRYNSSNIRYINNNGTYNNISIPSGFGFGVRAVIKISDITINEGEGTLVSNYQIANQATNTNNVQVGEYINVPYSGNDNACGSDNMCTFRVVSKDEENNRIKVILNGLLPTMSWWADNANDNITTSDLIYTNGLNSFIENIDSKYITTGTYGVGMYEKGNNYTVPQTTTITTNIGLPTVGEMFSGNDIDLGNVKIFVDVNTIENPTIISRYWTMNRNNSSRVRSIYDIGSINNFLVSDTGGLRAVIYLKSGNSSITFSSGEGTAQSPYVLQ